MLKNRILSPSLTFFWDEGLGLGNVCFRGKVAPVIQLTGSPALSVAVPAWCPGSGTLQVLPVKASITDWAERRLKTKIKISIPALHSRVRTEVYRAQISLYCWSKKTETQNSRGSGFDLGGLYKKWPVVVIKTDS